MRIAIGIIVILSIAVSLLAAEIEPSRLELSLLPGEASTTLIKVTNWLDYSVRINVKADYYRHILTDNSIPTKESKEKLPSCQDWLRLEPNQFELSSKASIYVKCIINVPKDAKEEHVASILFDEEGLITTFEKSPYKPGNITLKVIPRFTIPVYVAVKGKRVISAEISDMKVIEGPTLGTIKTEITLHNKGTMHLRPSGTLVFIDSKENIVKTLPIGQCLPVFPHYKEKIPVYYAEMLDPGDYTAVCTLNIGNGKLLHKKETFTITRDYDVK